MTMKSKFAVIIAVCVTLFAAVTAEAGEIDVFLLARNGTSQQLKEALKMGANFNVSRKAYDYEKEEEHYTDTFEYGETPLHLAAMYNTNSGVIKFLIEQGLDVNAVATSGNTIFETPLSCAVKNRNIDAVRELLKAGADPNSASSGNNGSMFHVVASEYKNYSDAKTVIAELIKAKGNINTHDEITQEEFDDWLQYEERENFRVKWSAYDPLGGPSRTLSHAARDNFLSTFTPLMFAVLYDNPDVVNLLLDAKADPNIRNLEGKTAFDYAVSMPNRTKIKRSPAFKRLKSLTTAPKSSRR